MAATRLGNVVNPPDICGIDDEDLIEHLISEQIYKAPVGDAFKAYEEGTISACNGPARARGVEVGMAVRDAAHALLTENH